MTSIRELHKAADAAREAVRVARIKLTTDFTQEVRDAYTMAVSVKIEAEAAVYDATYDLDAAVNFYRKSGDATTRQYDRLIAAALACHATDTEATP